MKILRHKKFKKQYQKLRKNEKERVKKAIRLFIANPHHTDLKNHALKSKLKGKRAFWIGGDLRIVFEEKCNYKEVLFLNIGSHNQVY